MTQWEEQMPESDAYLFLQNTAQAVGVEIRKIPGNALTSLIRQAEECIDERRIGATRAATAHQTECLRSMLRHHLG